ncbi:MAG: hypothetical protein IPK58_20055 [Acidobacteria bacterium]|nr:hypothetical protein [Acidobacteriota bacterium]
MSVKQDDETTITVAVGEKKRAEIAQAIAAALIEGYKKERKIYEKFARIIRDGGGILRKKLKDSFRITVTTEGGIPDVDECNGEFAKCRIGLAKRSSNP